MPWSPSDASAKTNKADTPKKRRQWRDVANGVLKRTGNEALAIREANGVLKRQANGGTAFPRSRKSHV